jgi:hypothetical protein
VVDVALGAGEGVLVGVEAGGVAEAEVVAGGVTVATGDGVGVGGGDVGLAVSGSVSVVGVAGGVAWLQPTTADKMHRQRTASAL